MSVKGRYLMATVVCGVYLLAVGMPAVASATHTVHGIVVITNAGQYPGLHNDPCSAPADMAGVKEGARVSINSNHGKVLGSAKLSAGNLGGDGDGCYFTFTVKGIPDVAAYNVDFPGGSVAYPHKELVDQKWQLFAGLDASS